MGWGLDYMRNRWYEEATGRFLSEDPIGLEGGINPYVFAGNDPVNRRDATGLTVYVEMDWLSFVDAWLWVNYGVSLQGALLNGFNDLGFSREESLAAGFAGANGCPAGAQWPVRGSQQNISRHWTGREHLGTDFAAPYVSGTRDWQNLGAPIYALAPGWVWATNLNGGNKGGRMVFILHPGGFRSKYAHLAGIGVWSGWVDANTIIGTMGNSPAKNVAEIGVHLHVELEQLVGGKWQHINPERCLP